MFGQKSHLDILEEHRKLIEKFGIASAAASKSCEESFEEKPDVESGGVKTVKMESDPIDLTFKTSDDDKYEAAAETGTRTPESCRVWSLLNVKMFLVVIFLGPVCATESGV